MMTAGNTMAVVHLEELLDWQGALLTVCKCLLLSLLSQWSTHIDKGCLFSDFLQAFIFWWNSTCMHTPMLFCLFLQLFHRQGCPKRWWWWVSEMSWWVWVHTKFCFLGFVHTKPTYVRIYAPFNSLHNACSLWLEQAKLSKWPRLYMRSLTPSLVHTHVLFTAWSHVYRTDQGLSLHKSCERVFC